MSLIVEDGSAMTNSESYISVANAGTYLSNRGMGDAWDAIDNKEAALRLATDYMKQRYRTRWVGFRVKAEQALEWPRSFVPYIDAPSGYRSSPAYYPYNAVPAEITWACALLALKTASGELLPDLTTRVIEKQVGPLKVVYDSHSPEEKRFSAIDELLAPFMNAETGAVPLGRA